MAVPGAQQRITDAVLQWPAMTVAPHRFGGVEYQLGTREIGHVPVIELLKKSYAVAQTQAARRGSRSTAGSAR